ELDFCFADHVCAPFVDGAVAFEYVTSTVAPPLSVSESTVVVCPLTKTVPDVAETWPAPAAVVGAVQPLGTSMVIAPLVIPPVAAVYVKVIELPVELRSAVVVAVLSVPEPCGAFWTSIDGEDASAVYEPPPVERCRVPHDCAPVEVGAVPVYVIVSVEPA